MAKGKSKAQGLPAEVSEKFEMLAGHNAGEYSFKGELVDLRIISLAEAQALAENGFHYLVALPDQETITK